MRKQHVVQLSEAERTELERVVTKGKAGARVIRRAHTLLLSDEGKTDQAIAKLWHVDELTVARTRKQWVERHTLTEQPRRSRGRRLDGKQEAMLVALACSEAPEGRSTWTLQLLADKLLALKVVEEPISDETVRRTLKKTSLSRGSSKNGVSPK
jgi:transposase